MVTTSSTAMQSLGEIEQLAKIWCLYVFTTLLHPAGISFTQRSKIRILHPVENKKLSLCWQTRATHLVVSQSHQTFWMVTIPYVRYSFLLCNSNFVFKRHRFYDIRLQKMSWPWNRGQRSLKVIERGTIWKIVYGFLLVFFSNIVPKTHCFWDIWLQNCHGLENRVRGPSRLLDMSPCDRAHMTSYWRSVVTMALSRVVSEIFNIEKCRDLEIGVIGHSRSLTVVSFDRLCMVSY